jgi:hypothetical protein
MKKILIEVIDGALRIPSEYNRLRVKDMVAKGTKLFELTPRIRGSKEQRGYLEGAVIPSYAKWQYSLNPRNPKTAKVARNLFKQDFWYTVIKNRHGNPKKTLKSLLGSHAEALNIYTEWASENGAPIPNESLYKRWRDEWSSDFQWQNYYDWLDFLGISEDSMPTEETFKKLL